MLTKVDKSRFLLKDRLCFEREAIRGAMLLNFVLANGHGAEKYLALSKRETIRVGRL